MTEIDQAYRRRVRAAVWQAVEVAASCEEGQRIDSLLRAIETVCTLMQFSAMVALVNEIDREQFMMMAGSLFDMIERNRPDDEVFSSRVH